MSGINSKEENRLLDVAPASGRNLSSPEVKSNDDGLPQPTDPDNIMTAGDLARYLYVHRSTVYRLLKEGQIPGFRVGSDWRLSRQEIDHWRLRQQK